MRKAGHAGLTQAKLKLEQKHCATWGPAAAVAAAAAQIAAGLLQSAKAAAAAPLPDLPDHCYCGGEECAAAMRARVSADLAEAAGDLAGSAAPQMMKKGSRAPATQVGGRSRPQWSGVPQ
eukprot:1158528-Pelagomonas_calceolata.AAC.3